MPTATCKTCAASIEYDFRPPFTVVTNPYNGKQAVSMDFTPIYEHAKTEHPELWTDKLAQEYAQYQKGDI